MNNVYSTRDCAFSIDSVNSIYQKSVMSVTCWLRIYDCLFLKLSNFERSFVSTSDGQVMHSALLFIRSLFGGHFGLPLWMQLSSELIFILVYACVAILVMMLVRSCISTALV